MIQVTNEGFIAIGDQVAMPEETVMRLLNVDRDKLCELVRTVDMSNKEGGTYSREGKMYFASPEVIFKIRNANGKKSADLSRGELYQLFEKAEERLLPREVVKAKRKKLYIKMGIFLLAIIGFFVYGANSPSTSPNPPPPQKIERSAEKTTLPGFERPEKSFLSESYKAIADKTRLLVTESWVLEFDEHVTPDGKVDTHGFVELDGDGIKRQFWLIFDGSTRRVLRVKIDSDVIYSELGW